jgi:GTPase SAR1 family protein
MSIYEEVPDTLDNMLEYKVVVVGDKGVGKSALVRIFCTDQFAEVNIYYIF